MTDPHYGVDRDRDRDLADFDARIDWLERREAEIYREWCDEILNTRRVDWLGQSVGEIFMDARAIGISMRDHLKTLAAGVADYEDKGNE